MTKNLRILKVHLDNAFRTSVDFNIRIYYMSLPDKDQSSRAWIFTLNNYTPEDEKNVLEVSDFCQYIIVGKEIAPTTKTPHYQGYIYFKNSTSFSSCCKKIPRAHFLIALGSAAQNYKYCSEDGNLLIEKGLPPKQGKRNDIADVIVKLKAGANMRALIDDATSYQSMRMAELWLKYNETGREWLCEIHWYHGHSGGGKTRSAREWLGTDIYSGMDTSKWWEGYDAHENVLIDDMRKDFAKYHVILKLLDRYPYRVECKGGSRQLLAKKIAITSPYSPEVLFCNREDKYQLVRRITKVILVGDPVTLFRGEYTDFDHLEEKL